MTTLHLSGEPDPTQRDLMRGAVECSHDLASPALAEHVAAVREARPPRYGHEVAPMPELAWVWTGIANAGARARRDDWPIDLARDIVTDLVSPQVFGPNLLKLLKLHGIDPATIRPYGGAK